MAGGAGVPPGQQFCVRWNSYQTNLQAVFPRLLSTERFADVTLACSGKQLRCHKVVLSACSAYFEKLLLQNPCKHPIIFMKDMRWSEMRALVEFMYRGEVNVTQEELPSLLRSAEALHIRGLCAAEGPLAAQAPAPPAGMPPHDPVTPTTQPLNGNNGTTMDTPPAKKARSEDKSEQTQHHGNSHTQHHGNSHTQHHGNPQTQHEPHVERQRTTRQRHGDAATGTGVATHQLHSHTDIKEETVETVEEDGLYYGDIDHEQDQHDYNDQDDDSEHKAGSSASQASGPSMIRVKPETELLEMGGYMSKLSKMDAEEMRREFAKYGFQTEPAPAHVQLDERQRNKQENDYYKSWLEQNGELEVSLLKASDRLKRIHNQQKSSKSEVELIPKNKSLLEKTLTKKSDFLKLTDLTQKVTDMVNEKAKESSQMPKRRGRPPIYKETKPEVSESLQPADLEQFLEGKEVSSSGLSRKDLEKVMMGKFNPNRRYSNEAMWAALMDVKRGGSIYRAAQTHKVPRKSLRNWMKRCHIKSSFPMPQQLKQFVENNRKQKDSFKHFPHPDSLKHLDQQTEAQADQSYDDFEFGKHFLTYTGSNPVSSEDELLIASQDQNVSELCENVLHSDNSQNVADGDKPPDHTSETESQNGRSIALAKDTSNVGDALDMSTHSN